MTKKTTANELRALDWKHLLQELSELATSHIAKESLKELKPFEQQKQATKELKKVQQARRLLVSGHRPFMESLDVYSTWYLRLQKQATLKSIEFRDIRYFMVEVLTLKEALEEQETPWAEEIKSTLMDAESSLSAIDQIFTNDGAIKSDASETLYKFYREKNQLEKEIQNKLDKLVKDNSLESLLQDRYVTNREGRWVLPIKSGMQHSFEGLIHDASHSKQTVFMEPQAIIPTNNRLREVQNEIDEEIERLLVQLSEYFFTLKEEIESSQQCLLETDKTLAKAQLAQNIQANEFEFENEQFELKELKHPLLVLHSENQNQVVGNDIKLDQTNRILLLSGPNAGGKTVLLKAVGLAAQMARCGLPISASTDSKLPFLKDIHLAIGDLQSVEAHLSTFAGHLKNLNQATEFKDLDHVVLIDEICGATDPEEGAALARSFVQTYAENNVFAVITSHFSPLKRGWEPGCGVINGSMEYDKTTGHPTYQFIMGVPGDSFAIETATRVGVNKDIIQKALNYLTPEHRKRLEGQNEIEQIKSSLNHLRQSLKKEIEQAHKKQNQLQFELDKLNKDKEKILNAEVEKIKSQLQEEAQKAQVKKTFKNFDSFVKMQTQKPEVIKSPEQIKIETAEEFKKSFPPGSKVYVQTIGRDAVVQSTPNNKGEVEVLSESMRLMVPWTELSTPKQFHNPNKSKIVSSASKLSPLDTDRSLDVRGLSSDEAVEKLELALDSAVVNQEDRLKLIHGHGTESLKRNLRGYLSRSVYVKKWTAGTPQTGGDGITWVELNS